MQGIRSEWLAKSHTLYVTKWLRAKWGKARAWHARFPAMVVWYSKEGSNRPNIDVADHYADNIRRGRVRSLPDRPRRTLEDASGLARHISLHRGTNPIDWFTGRGGDLQDGWRALDMVCGVGPKIASFILRDLSLLRDYSNGAGAPVVTYRHNRDRRWFDALRADDQALFMPIDIYVHRFAREHRASGTCTRRRLADIQWDADLHRRAGAEIVRWALARSFDPRDLNVYWYSLGAENIREDGTPTY